MINVVEDIAKILKYDKSHDVKVLIDVSGVTVTLVEKSFMSVPIRYECENGVYIDNKTQDGTICVSDIGILKNIMEYLEDHMNELDELCNQCDWSGRQREN